jgi:hypothetical protein
MHLSKESGEEGGGPPQTSIGAGDSEGLVDETMPYLVSEEQTTTRRMSFADWYHQIVI